jgi:hypothetical protein
MKLFYAIIVGAVYGGCVWLFSINYADLAIPYSVGILAYLIMLRTEKTHE